MDTQGGIPNDPVDQWVLDPKTGTYRLRLEPADVPAAAPRVPVQGGGRERPGQQRQSEGERPGRGHSGRNGSRAGTPAGSRRGRQQNTRKKALVWTAGVLGFVLVAGAAGGYLVYRHFNSNITAIDVGNAGSRSATNDGPVNILVIGTDSRQGLGAKYGDAGSVGHADTTILFHVSKDRSNATALSIPRDLVTAIPACPTKQKDGSTKTVPGTPQRDFGPRFNESLGQEGRDPGCTMRTVTELTGGIPIDHFMMVDFEAVKTISTAVDGVPICLGKAVHDTTATGEGSHLNLPAGPSKVEGEQALALVRTRHSIGNGSDLSRIQLQQQFMSSMIRQVKSNGTLTDPPKLFKLANAATKALTVDTAIGSGTKLASLAKDLSSVDTKHMTFTTLPVKDNPAEDPSKRATVVVDQTKAPQVFSMIKNDISLTGAPKKKAVVDARLRGVKADPSEIRVKVFNGGGPQGAAQATLNWLQNTKLVNHSTNSGNAPDGRRPKTTLVYAPGQADQARALAAMMGLPASALRPGTAGAAAPEADMTLTLGADFKAAGTPLTTPTNAPDDIQRTEADKSVCID